jgi:hypothetical protein
VLDEQQLTAGPQHSPQPMEHVLRQCLIALRLADRAGLDEQDRMAAYYTALLVNVGCHADAHEQRLAQLAEFVEVATLEEDFGQAVDVLRRVIDLMAEKDAGSAKLPEIERMARDENRVVIRVRPFATFATPPRHVYKPEDIDTLTHFTSSSQPW